MPRALYLIAYDISDTNRRYRIHTLLKGYAVGGQKSLFECWLKPYELEKLQQDLLPPLLKAGDKLHIFRLSDPAQLYGAAQKLDFDPFLII